MPGFHSDDDDFLYESQRRDRKEPAASIHRKTAAQAAAKAATEAARHASLSSDLPPGCAFTLNDAAAYSGTKICFLRRAIHDERLPAKLAENASSSSAMTLCALFLR